MHPSFLVITAIWFLVVLGIATRSWKLRRVTVGMVLTYTFFFTINHFLQGMIYALPWYVPLYSPDTILSGYILSLIALISFGAGFASLPFVRRIHLRIINPGRITPSSAPSVKAISGVSNWLPVTYIGLGLIAALLLEPLFADSPTLSTAIYTLQRLYHVGIVFGIWRILASSRSSPNRRLLILFALTAAYPLFVLTNDGFLGKGLFPTLYVLVFAAIRSGKTKLLTLLAPCLLYVGLTVSVTYFEGRSDIRQVVWGGASVETRTDVIVDVFFNRLQLFDIFNQEHVQFVDSRLVLNWFVGLGIERLSSGTVSFANGDTIIDAFLAVLPRVVWPDKPSFVGGQALVNKYTGVVLYGATSAGLGQVLEAYVNFGIVGVVISFFSIGLFLALLDSIVFQLLQQNNYSRAALLVVPFFSLWLIEDNAVTIIASSISSILTITFINVIMTVILSFGKTAESLAPRKAIPPLSNSIGQRKS